MNRYLHKITLWLFLSFLPFILAAEMDYVVIGSISIEGNNRTKDKIIYREINFSVGDSIPVRELGELLSYNRLLLMNSGLFNAANINIKSWNQKNNHINLVIEVKESWYIYPFPTISLADRNFNVWWNEFDHSLRRVNYALRFYHFNTTGHRDRLKLVFQLGYTQRFEVKYSFPYLNKAQTLGLETNVFYARNREIPFTTLGNKIQFFRSEEDYQLTRFRAGVTITNRPKILVYHKFTLEFHRNSTSHLVINDLNTNYFLGGKTKQRLFYLQYEYIYDNRDIRPYPLNGNYFHASIEKEGVGIFNEQNGLFTSAEYHQYVPLSKKFNLELIGKGRVALIRSWQPYNSYTGLGYGRDYLRGYEFYVMDGLDFGYLKSSIRYELFNRNISFGKFMPLDSYRLMPFKIYLSLNNDTGYVNDPQFAEQNNLSNKLLWGGGLGLNFVFFYDKVINLEYSFNQLGENGLFLHVKLSF